MEYSRKLYNKIAFENEYIKRNINLYSTLTQREKNIISFMVRGYDIKTISERLMISESTVKKYEQNIKSKLSLNNGAELIKFARVFELV